MSRKLRPLTWEDDQKNSGQLVSDAVWEEILDDYRRYLEQEQEQDNGE